MKNILSKVILLLLIAQVSFGQVGSFTINLSSDTILAGNVLEVTFVADNIKGNFEGPDLAGLQVVSGPNMASSMTMINGEVNQTSSYTYGVLLDEIGEVTILSGYLNAREESFETEPVTILVLPNPEGIIEQAPAQSGLFEFNFPDVQQKSKSTEKKKSKTNKKKRILRKI